MGWLSVANGFTAEVMARQGFDALVIDMQHGLTDMANLWPMLQAVSQTDTVPVVRVAANDPATIMKALDFGAYGILVPLINTAEDAAKAHGIKLQYANNENGPEQATLDASGIR